MRRKRYRKHLVILKLLGTLLMVLGLFQATAILIAVWFSETDSLIAYLISVILLELIGFGLYVFGKRFDTGTLQRRTAIATVAFSWLAAGIFGSIAFLLDGAMTSPVNAFFETVSGFTTTGSTILENIEAVSKTSLYWRSLIQWLGGMGIIVLFIAIFPQMGVGAKHMFKSEVPGPITEGLKPKIRETSSMLWKIYLGLTGSLILLLWLVGLSPYDAICHAFTTMATGGFSTYNASIKHFDSALVDGIITIFMFLAGINFSLYYLLRKGNWLGFLRNSELRIYGWVVVISTIVVTISILQYHDYNPLTALRYAAFQVVSVVTTTGFGTDDFNTYPVISKMLLLFIMAMGASAGSTSGGIKISRIMIMFKAIGLEISKVFQPQYVKVLHMNRVPIAPEVTRGVLTFVLLFVSTLLFGSVFMAFLGLDMEAAFTSVLTATANVGPGLGAVGPVENFNFIPGVGKIFLSFCMILGRLEFYTLLVLWIPNFWRD